MRFNIKVSHDIEKTEPVLLVYFYTKKDEDYRNGCQDGIYHCCSSIPESKEGLINLIELSINACLDMYQMEEL